jgi:hypothetical protein
MNFLAKFDQTSRDIFCVSLIPALLTLLACGIQPGRTATIWYPILLAVAAPMMWAWVRSLHRVSNGTSTTGRN